MIKLKTVLHEALVGVEDPLEGKSKQNAKNYVLKKVNPLTRGKFSDNYWKPIQDIFKLFDEEGFRWVPGSTKYDEERVYQRDGSAIVVPVRKTWQFEIRFRNNKDSEDVLYGQIVAAGAGSVEDPLDEYDVNVTVS